MKKIKQWAQSVWGFLTRSYCPYCEKYSVREVHYDMELDRQVYECEKCKNEFV